MFSAMCVSSAIRRLEQLSLKLTSDFEVSEVGVATSLRIEDVSEIGLEHNGLQLKKQGLPERKD
jgi:hypothetical protein